VREPLVLAVRSVGKAATLDDLHCCFGHIDVGSLQNLHRKGFVSSLDMVGSLQMTGTCKDCIFGKMHVWSYNEDIIHKKDLLEQVHIDLWGPSSVVLARISHYFMFIINSTSSFQFVEFLREKTVEVTLNVLKKFMVEVE